MEQQRVPVTCHEKLLSRLEELLGNDFVTWTVEIDIGEKLELVLDHVPSPTADTISTKSSTKTFDSSSPTTSSSSYHIPIVIDVNEGVQGVRPGAILCCINDHITLDDEITDIHTFLTILYESQLPRKLKFCRVGQRKDRIWSDGDNCCPRDDTTVLFDAYGFSSDIHSLSLLKTHQRGIHTAKEKMRRDLEWIAYLKAIGGTDNVKPAGVYKPSHELKYMVRRGIPAAFRPVLWLNISLASIQRRQRTTTFYADLIGNIDTLSRCVRGDIDKDVDRTFPEHAYFDQGVENGLRRVLCAFALHNPSIGYCQSLNFIAGVMLLFLQEEDAFWLLVTVVETLLPKDYFSKSMVGMCTDQLVLARLVEMHLPNVHAALQKSALQLSLVTVPWFLCLFINTFHTEVLLRVWDVFLCEGNKALFRIAVALIQSHEQAIVNARDHEELFQVFKSIGKEEVDADALLALAYKPFVPASIKHKIKLHGGSSSSSSMHKNHHQRTSNHHNNLITSTNTTNSTNINAINSTNHIKITHNSTITTSSNHHHSRSRSVDAGLKGLLSRGSSLTNETLFRGTFQEKGPYALKNDAGMKNDHRDNSSVDQRKSKSVHGSKDDQVLSGGGGVGKGIGAKIMRVLRDTSNSITKKQSQSFFQFKRADIDHLRQHFRPELEEKYIELERARLHNSNSGGESFDVDPFLAPTVINTNIND